MSTRKIKISAIEPNFQCGKRQKGECSSIHGDDSETENKAKPDGVIKKAKLMQSSLFIKTPVDSNVTRKAFETISPLQWRKIVAENLNLAYTKLFSRIEADRILQRLEKEVVYFTGDLLKVQIFGKWHNIPRKQVSFGDSGLSYKFSGNCIPALEWTPLMLELKQAVENATNQKFNFVLVNRYKDGEDYMGEHRDDEKDLVVNASIASLSFGQSRDFIFKHKDSRGSKATRQINPVKLLLEHGSLLIMNGPTNDFWYHSLPVRKKALNVRVNLTFRKMVVKTVP